MRTTYSSAEDKHDPRQHKIKTEPLIVIVVLTRKLAVQTFDEARRICYHSMAVPKPNTAVTNYNPHLYKAKAEQLVVIVVPTRELAI
ncbi:hypothetical protein KC315_g12466 [Hortaea werneckii]|nr:hypothetical protein KC315_g12466 [Hortaea werneckii]